jgi:septal ring factor EnvC (AmiA/AmiB activator)
VKDEDAAARELGQLRDILLAPVEERNKQRDEQILDFVEDLAKSLTARINDLEQRIEQLNAQAEDDRRHVVENMADAMACLGSQLREASRTPDPYGLQKDDEKREAG